MKSKTTIELNGNHYDSLSGKLLIQVQDGTDEPQRITPKLSTSRAANHAKAHAPTIAARQPVTRPVPVAPTTIAVTVAKPRGKPVNHAKAHSTQHAVTLRRDAVKKPAPSLVRQLKPQSSLQHTVPSLIVPKQSAATIDPSRLARAQSTERSPQIGRHSVPVSNVLPTFTSLAVQPVPVKPQEEVPSNPPAPMPSNKPTDNLFDHALANAANYVDVHAHTKHYKQKVHTHLVSMAAGTLALVIIAAFGAYLNTPGLQVKVAGMQAGISTRMPNLAATGFAFDGVKAQDGKLTLGLSGSHGSYHLTQQASNLSSESMIHTVGSTDASGKPTYTEVRVGDTVVYRFANTDATWVANGKWYTLSGTSSLTDSQVSTLVRNI